MLFAAHYALKEWLPLDLFERYINKASVWFIKATKYEIENIPCCYSLMHMLPDSPGG